MHLMLTFVVRRAIRLAASVSRHHGQFLLFPVHRDSSWFQHHGQLPTLYSFGSWSEMILAWKSGASLLTNPCPLHRRRLILSYFKLCTSHSKAEERIRNWHHKLRPLADRLQLPVSVLLSIKSTAPLNLIVNKFKGDHCSVVIKENISFRH